MRETSEKKEETSDKQNETIEAPMTWKECKECIKADLGRLVPSSSLDYNI